MAPKKKTDEHDKRLKINLQALLEERNMSRYDLAEKTGLDYSSISDLANDKYKRIGIDTLEKLCKALNVEVGELLVWE